ncbi:hypothetical protein V6N13_080848 [Hibiscus sabdariffa]|uniref:Uncharacterized protein n=2 Tax=Hibiscus sabdariffa TaxID=183260 RepID=A0ABR2NSD8_9ROSI
MENLQRRTTAVSDQYPNGPRDAGSITINGTVYRVQNIHWHSPSEHTFDGVRFPLEVHIVHRSDQNTRAVVSMLYRIGQPDPFLTRISPILSVLRTERPLGVVNPEEVGIQGSSYYRYNGSLTVPPCTEDVVWTVYLMIKQATENQIQQLKNVLPPQNRNNSRPTQPLNNRDVLFRPGGASSIDNI